MPFPFHAHQCCPPKRHHLPVPRGSNPQTSSFSSLSVPPVALTKPQASLTHAPGRTIYLFSAPLLTGSPPPTMACPSNSPRSPLPPLCFFGPPRPHSPLRGSQRSPGPHAPWLLPSHQGPDPMQQHASQLARSFSPANSSDAASQNGSLAGGAVGAPLARRVPSSGGSDAGNSDLSQPHCSAFTPLPVLFACPQISLPGQKLCSSPALPPLPPPFSPGRPAR